MMKKILLGTTLLMSVASFSAANAGEPLKLGISGFFHSALGFTADSKYDEGDHRRNANLKNNVEVHFGGEFTLDIGVTAGVRVELEGQTHGDQIDATYAFLRSGLGEVRVGDFNSAAGLLCNGLQTASNAFPVAGAMNFSNLGNTRPGAATPRQLVQSDGTDVCNIINNKPTKIAYFSPSLAGFHFGTSYTIDDTENSDSNAAGGLSTQNGGNSREWSIGLQYDANIGDFGISAYAGWEKSFDPEVGNDKASYYQFGGGVSFGNLSFSIGYQQGFNIGSNIGGGDANDMDTKTVGLSGVYTLDAFKFGFTWLRAFYDQHGNFKRDTHDVYMLTTSYALGTGVTLDGAVTHDVYNSHHATTSDYKSYTFQFGMTIGF